MQSYAQIVMSNRKLLNFYRQNLQSGPLDVYTNIANKLAEFLSDKRAYYFEARPVVSLLTASPNPFPSSKRLRPDT